MNKGISSTMHGVLIGLILIALLALIAGCSRGLSSAVDAAKSPNYYFNVTRTKVFYSPMGNSVELGKHEVVGADPATFRVTEADFALDAKHRYYQYYRYHSQRYFIETLAAGHYQLCWLDSVTRRCMEMFEFQDESHFQIIDELTVAKGQTVYSIDTLLGYVKEQSITDYMASQQRKTSK